MVIYGDIYFIINFSMDFICLYICLKLLKLKIRFKSVALASSVGGGFSLLLLFLDTGRFISLLLTVATGLVMCKIAVFSKKSHREKVKMKDFFLIFIVYTAVSFFMAGGLTFIYTSANEFLPGSANSSSGGLLFPAALLCTVASIFLSSLSKSEFKAKRCSITLEVDKKSVSFEGLIDSGNLLCEPISGLPVIILSKNISFEIEPNGDFSPGHLVSKWGTHKKLRIIPTSPGHFTGPLTAFYPDRLEINGFERQCYIALSDHEKFGGCSALVPTSLLTI